MVSIERERPAVQLKRAEFAKAIQAIDPERLFFIDETGSHIAMTREYGWSRAGERIVDRVPRNRGRVLTVIGALTMDGLEAVMTVEGGTTARVFRRFVDDHLGPCLCPGDVVVMDNLGSHHATGIRNAIEVRGATVLYMPPYSPDLNPIELCWSKLKNTLKSIGARTRERLRQAVRRARAAITSVDACSWFAHCGVDPQLS